MVKFVMIYGFYCPYALSCCRGLKYVWTAMFGFGKELGCYGSKCFWVELSGIDKLIKPFS